MSKLTTANIEDGAVTGAKLGTTSLAELNTALSDATVDDSGDSRTPLAHDLDSSLHNNCTLAELAAKVSDDGLIGSSEKGAANGVATLDGGGKVPASQLDLDSVDYQGAWDADTNDPTLVSSTGTKGYYYVVSVAGSTNLDGITDWEIGDWAIFNGSVWEKVDNTDSVTSVAGKTGAVTLVHQTDLTAGDGTDHANVVLNDAHRAGDGSDHADVATNTTHSTGDGSDHADVATNTTHSTGDGSDHADVATNNAHRVDTANPHGTDIENLGSGTLAELNDALSDAVLGRPKHYLHKVTAGEVGAGYLTLSETPVSAASVMASIVKGLSQVNKQVVGATGATPDFDVLSNTQLHINNNGAAEGLSGDIVENTVLDLYFLY
jgi:hypothetical protein